MKDATVSSGRRRWLSMKIFKSMLIISREWILQDGIRSVTGCHDRIPQIVLFKIPRLRWVSGNIRGPCYEGWEKTG